MNQQLPVEQTAPTAPADIDQLLQRLIDRANQGEPVDVESLCQQYPNWAVELRRLLPTLLLFDQSRQWLARLAEGSVDAGLGSHIANYRLGRVIGRGGMGVVYEATQSPLGRRVAVKLLRDVEATAAARERFEREFQIAAKLHHTNIVPVFDAGEENDQLYFAMQLIEGVNAQEFARQELDSRSRSDKITVAEFADTKVDGRGKQPVASAIPGNAERTVTSPRLASARVTPPGQLLQRVATIGRQIATALDYAHQRGILHRDIKPSNILIDIHDNPWISDFGLAKPVEGQDLTKSGDIAGTLKYLAPERLHGQSDPRADIYALGLVLAEMATGRSVWEGLSGPVLLKQLLHGGSCPLVKEAQLPADFRMILLKATQPHPELRYATALELADDLQRFIESRPVQARRFSRLRSAGLWVRRNPGMAGLMTLTALTLILGSVTAVVLARNWRIAAQEAETRAAEALLERDRANESLTLAQRALAELTSGTVQRFLSSQPKLTEADREFLDSVLAHHAKLRDLAASDQWARTLNALALRDVARIRHVLGQIDLAEQELRRSVTEYQSLATDFPGTPEYRMEVAASLLNLGRLLGENRKLNQALQAFQHARDELASLPPIPNFQGRIDKDLATTENNIGLVFQIQGKFEEAVRAFQNAIGRQRALVDASQEDPQYLSGLRADLARSLSNLSECYIKAGRDDEAQVSLDEALRIRTELVESDRSPENGLAMEKSLVVSARLEARQARIESARQLLTQAADIDRQVVSDFPGVPMYRYRWASTMGELAELLADSGEIDLAREQYEAQIATLRAVVAEVPSQQSYRRALAEALHRLAQLMRHVEADRAKVIWEEALSLLEAMVSEDAADESLQELINAVRESLRVLQDKTLSDA